MQGTHRWFEKTYVFHESTIVIPSISILLTRCSRRTILRFLYVVLSELSFDSLTGQAERASVEPPIAVVHLQDIVGLGNEMSRGNNERFVLFISFNA